MRAAITSVETAPTSITVAFAVPARAGGGARTVDVRATVRVARSWLEVDAANKDAQAQLQKTFFKKGAMNPEYQDLQMEKAIEHSRRVDEYFARAAKLYLPPPAEPVDDRSRQWDGWFVFRGGAAGGYVPLTYNSSASPAASAEGVGATGTLSLPRLTANTFYEVRLQAAEGGGADADAGWGPFSPTKVVLTPATPWMVSLTRLGLHALVDVLPASGMGDPAAWPAMLADDDAKFALGVDSAMEAVLRDVLAGAAAPGGKR